MAQRKPSLNPQQHQAVMTTDGPLLVLAGAGTGKTRVVTERIAHLLRQGVSPDNILAVTFTNKAANEMKERVKKLVGKRNDLHRMIVSTFHSLCVRLLRRDAEALGYQCGFTIADQGEQTGLVRKALKTVRGAGTAKPEDLLAMIGRLKNAGVTPEAAERRALDDEDQLVAAVYRRYQESLRRIQAFDFDDLLLSSVVLLEKHERAQNYWPRRFRYIMVDEFQDTNHVQYRLIELLASHWGNLCVVGDDDQSIYGWRGAVTENILNFHTKFPGAVVVRLEENYRSTGTILNAANALIAHNEARCGKTLWSKLGTGSPVRVLAAEDQQDEAGRIAAEIKNRVMRGDLQPADVAILIRTNHQTRPFEEELRTAQLPYAVVGGKSFFDRKEVRDVLSYLAIVANPADDGALARIINVPARGIGDRTVDGLAAHAARQGVSLSKALAQAMTVDGLSPNARKACSEFHQQLEAWRAHATQQGLADLVSRIVEDSRYIEEIEHLYDDPLDRSARLNMAHEVGDSLRAYLERDNEGDLAGFLQEAALWGRDDERDEGRSAVKLITAHSAKGLEYPVVYVVGFEEGLMPHKNHEEANTLEEERRLCYVALTRARRELTLSYCRARVSRGRSKPCTPSRFLNEIPPELLDRRDELIKQGECLDEIRALRERLAGQA